MSRSRSSPRRYALGGLALALLFGVSQGATFAHRLQVQHAVCAEHGELVHVEPALASAAGLEKEVRGLPVPPVDHSHDHCLITLPRREDFLIDEPADALLARLYALPAAGEARAVPAPKGIALLRLAPKSSPPA